MQLETKAAAASSPWGGVTQGHDDVFADETIAKEKLTRTYEGSWLIAIAMAMPSLTPKDGCSTTTIFVFLTKRFYRSFSVLANLRARRSDFFPSCQSRKLRTFSSASGDNNIIALRNDHSARLPRHPLSGHKDFSDQM